MSLRHGILLSVGLSFCMGLSCQPAMEQMMPLTAIPEGTHTGDVGYESLLFSVLPSTPETFSESYTIEFDAQGWPVDENGEQFMPGTRFDFRYGISYAGRIVTTIQVIQNGLEIEYDVRLIERTVNGGTVRLRVWSPKPIRIWSTPIRSASRPASWPPGRRTDGPIRSRLREQARFDHDHAFGPPAAGGTLTCSSS